MQKDKADVGKTRDVRYQIGVRRTMPVECEKAWQILTSAKGMALWLGGDSEIVLKKDEKYRLPDGTTGEVRVCKANSHLRITWQPEDWDRPSTIQIRVIANGENTIVAFHQENLPDANAREGRRKFFVDVLQKFEHVLNTGE